jgi:hypothetical protein
MLTPPPAQPDRVRSGAEETSSTAQVMPEVPTANPVGDFFGNFFLRQMSKEAVTARAVARNSPAPAHHRVRHPTHSGEISLWYQIGSAMRVDALCPLVSTVIGATFAGILSGPAPAGVPGDQAAALSFEKSPQPFGTTNTFQIVLGDVDGDGDLDAALANARRGRSQVLLNDGAGYLKDTNQELTPQGHGLGLGDLDGDGDLDLFVTCAHFGETADSMKGLPSRVYLNDGHGRFSDTGQDLNDTDLSGNAVTLHDIDGDGDLDAAVDYHKHANGIYLNDGNGRFALSKASYPDGSTWGDLDADGDVDLVVRQIGFGFRTMLNDGSGAFADRGSLHCKDLTQGRGALGDLDGDGDLDAVMTNGDWESQHPTLVLLNDGGGRFTDTGRPLTPVKWGRVAIGDLDGDGDLDVVLTGFEQHARVWLNDGTGRFRKSPARLSDDRQHFADVSLGDLDNDHDLDIFLGNFFGGPNEIWLNRIQ